MLVFEFVPPQNQVCITRITRLFCLCKRPPKETTPEPPAQKKGKKSKRRKRKKVQPGGYTGLSSKSEEQTMIDL